jgi:hypothetical protein
MPSEDPEFGIPDDGMDVVFNSIVLTFETLPLAGCSSVLHVIV